MEECLICFNPITDAWSPPMSCSCRQTVHRACWLKWIHTTGAQICLICRKEPEEEEEQADEAAPEHHELELRILVFQRPPRGRRDCRNFFWWLLLFYFFGRVISSWVIAVAKLPPR